MKEKVLKDIQEMEALNLKGDTIETDLELSGVFELVEAGL